MKEHTGGDILGTNGYQQNGSKRPLPNIHEISDIAQSILTLEEHERQAQALESPKEKLSLHEWRARIRLCI